MARWRPPFSSSMEKGERGGKSYKRNACPSLCGLAAIQLSLSSFVILSLSRGHVRTTVGRPLRPAGLHLRAGRPAICAELPAAMRAHLSAGVSWGRLRGAHCAGAHRDPLRSRPNAADSPRRTPAPPKHAHRQPGRPARSRAAPSERAAAQPASLAPPKALAIRPCHPGPHTARDSCAQTRQLFPHSDRQQPSQAAGWKARSPTQLCTSCQPQRPTRSQGPQAK